MTSQVSSTGSSMPSRRHCMVLAALVMLTLLSLPASAQQEQSPNSQAAEAHFDQGRAFFDAGDWDRAIAEYKRANALVPHPLNHFNLGLAYRAKGELSAALAQFKRYLELDPKSRRTDEASAYDAELTKASVEADEKAKLRRRRDLIASGEAERRADEQTRTLRWAGLGTMAAGATVMAIGAYFGIDARNQAREIEDRTEPGTDQELNDAFDDGNSAEARFVVLTSVGAAAAITGGVVWYLGHRRRREVEREFLAGPTVHRGGAGLLVRLSF